MRGRGSGVEAPVGRSDGHRLIVGGIALVDAIDVPRVQRQTIDVPGAQGGAAKGLWQQSRGAGKRKRQEDRHVPGLHRGLGKTQLGGRGQARVLIRRPIVAGRHRQQLGAAAIRRGVELDPQQPADVQSKTQRPLGKPRLHVHDETLGPLLGSGLGSIVLVLAVQVVITQGQGAMAVFDKALGAKLGGQNAQAEQRQDPPATDTGHTGG
ncbi:hypothetical protein D3C81_1247770 [compost metagenome]